MAPKKRQGRRESMEEKAAKLRQRSLALQTKGMVTELIRIAKARADLVPLLLQHAYSLGAPRNDKPVEEEATATTTVPDSTEDASPEPVAKRGQLLDRIPKSHKTWQDVPTQYFVHVLSKCEPISLSAASLRQLCPARSKLTPEWTILEIWEMVTNM